MPAHPSLKKDTEQILNSWNEQNNLPHIFEKALRRELDL